MSNEIIWRLGRLSVGSIASVGYPRWFIYFHRRRLFMEIGALGHHFEFRWEAGEQ